MLFALYGIANCWADEDLKHIWDNTDDPDLDCGTPETWSNCYAKYWTISLIMIGLRLLFLACMIYCMYCFCGFICCMACCSRCRNKRTSDGSYSDIDYNVYFTRVGMRPGVF